MNWTERVSVWVDKQLALQQPILDDCKKQRRQNREINGRWRKGHREQFAKYQREYYQRPEAKRHRREQQREYNQRPEVKQRIREYQRDRYWRNPEKMRECARKYGQDHREHYREYHRKYYQNKKKVIKV